MSGYCMYLDAINPPEDKINLTTNSSINHKGALKITAAPREPRVLLDETSSAHNRECSACTPVREWTSSDVSTSYRFAVLSHEAVTACLPPTSQSAAMTTPWWLLSDVSGARMVGQSLDASTSASGSSLSEHSTSSSPQSCCWGRAERRFPGNPEAAKHSCTTALLLSVLLGLNQRYDQHQWVSGTKWCSVTVYQLHHLLLG